jgi:hypothetical protein
VNGASVLHRQFSTEIEAARAAEQARRVHMPFAQPDPELAKAEGAA